jgi:alkanesulfonate monooxygenase SsuD/methylene tetrahydromethanopterin reductase-like flavin-dependent oxidoreductase (luciferase family)
MMQYALYLPNFGAQRSARAIAELAREAEDAGWDGFFLWDHIIAGAEGVPMLDVWVTLSAIAMNTSRIRIGATVTPLARRPIDSLCMFSLFFCKIIKQQCCCERAQEMQHS